MLMNTSADTSTVRFLIAGAFTSRRRTTMSDQNERPSMQALRGCAEWLVTCLCLGWQREQLDALEQLWWQYHNRTGGRDE